MSNITNILEKLWKKVNTIAIQLSKETSPYIMIKNYHKVYSTLDKLKIEEQKTVEMIRENLLRSRPILPNRHQLEDYIKRIDFANDIISSLDQLVRKTFDTYIEFINIYWETDDNLDTNEKQKILYEKYDMSLTEWQSVANKIERFNDIMKNFI